jgi:hypothetical protein
MTPLALFFHFFLASRISLANLNHSAMQTSILMLYFGYLLFFDKTLRIDSVAFVVVNAFDV